MPHNNSKRNKESANLADIPEEEDNRKKAKVDELNDETERKVWMCS